MRILQVSHSFYPCFDSGGVVRVVYDLSRNLVLSGHDVTVYTTDGCTKRLDVKTDSLIMIDGVRVFYFRNISNLLRIKFKLATPYHFSKFKNLKNFDIIHVHEYRTILSILVLHYARRYNIPYVLQAHGSVLPIFQRQFIKMVFDLLVGKKILAGASKVIALTQEEARQYVDIGVPREKVEIIANGIDLSQFEVLPEKGTFREKYGLDDNKKIVLFLGRIHLIKGLDLLVDAFVDIAKIDKNILLIIVGPDAGILLDLKKKIKKLSVGSQILILGPLYGTNKIEAFLDADVYVLPSLYETFPLSVLEACALGIPVVITDRCGIADIVEDNVGFVVEYDKDQLSNAILKALYDNDVRKRFSENGSKLIAKEFNLASIICKIECLYKDILKNQ